VDYGIVYTLRQKFFQSAKIPIESEITQEVLILAKKNTPRWNRLEGVICPTDTMKSSLEHNLDFYLNNLAKSQKSYKKWNK